MFLILDLFLLLNLQLFAQETVQISQFGTEGIKGWENKSFKGETDYSLKEIDGRKYLYASAKAAASGLIKKQKVDIKTYPFLNWSWRIDKLIADNDERTKSGDDFPARIYVVISGGFTFWKTLALNLVWSNKSKVDEYWENPFTSNAMMYAVESGTKNLGKFINYKINIKETLKRTYQKDFNEIDAIAIMTDTDNTKSEASAYYSEIYFSR